MLLHFHNEEGMAFTDLGRNMGLDVPEHSVWCVGGAWKIAWREH